MANKSIGTLSAIITGQADQLVNELRRTQTAIDQSTQATVAGFAGLEKGSLRLGVGLMGARNLTQLALHEIRDVIANIDSIPNVPQATIESIHQMKYAFEASNTSIKSIIAQAVGWFADLGQNIGYFFGGLVYGWDNVAAAIEKTQKDAENFAKLDYIKNVAALREELYKLQNANSKGSVFSILQDEATALNNFAKTGVVDLGQLNNEYLKYLQTKIQLQGGVTEKDKQDASLRAGRDYLEITKIEIGEEQELIKLRREGGLLRERERLNAMTTKDALSSIDKQIKEITDKYANINNFGSSSLNSKLDPVELELYTKAYQRLIDLERERGQLIKQSEQWVKQVGSAFENAFMTAIKDGGGLRNLLHNITQDLITIFERIWLQKALIDPLMSSLKMGGSLGGIGKFLGFYADGGDIGTGGTAVVGENGPELFVPKTSGTIIPTGPTRAMMSGRGGGTYFIDARGADQAGIAQLWNALKSVNASIEQRAVGATLQQNFRSAGFRRAFA